MSTDQKTLVPSFIIHLNGKRIEMEEEYSVQRVQVHETLNNIASASVSFSDPDFQLQQQEEFSIGSEITVTIGYKDDVKSLFKGDIVGDGIALKKNGSAIYTLKALNKLHLLKHNRSQTVYYEMSDSEILETIAQNAGLSIETEDFGRTSPVYANPLQSDYDLLRQICDYHGYDFYLRDTTLYIEKHSSKSGSDVILEWGKTLTNCHYKDDVSHQITKSIVSSTAPYSADGFTSEIGNDVVQGDGPAYAEEFGERENLVRETDCISTDETDARAETIFVQHARKFQHIEGMCEGNVEIVAGSVIQLKEIGNRISNEYLVSDVSHILEADKGYRTEFHLVSNVGAPDGGPTGGTKSDDQSTQESSDAKDDESSYIVEEEEEEEVSKQSVSQEEETEDDSDKEEDSEDPILREASSYLGAAGGAYGDNNRCDDWAKKRLDDAGVDTSGLFASPFSSSDVSAHLKHAVDNNLGHLNPTELADGWYLVFMDDAQAKDATGNPFHSHCGILKVAIQETPKSVDFYDSSNGNTDHLPAKHGYTSFANGFVIRNVRSYGHYKKKVFISVKPQ